MYDKTSRQNTIKELVKAGMVHSQEELQEFGSGNGAPGIPNSISSDGVLSIEFSGSLAVIKTRPGFANVVGAILDASHVAALMGTIAGDDTVLLVLRDAYTRADVLDSLSQVLPGIVRLVK